MQGLADDDIDVLWLWLKNIAAQGLTKDKENEIAEILKYADSYEKPTYLGLAKI